MPRAPLNLLTPALEESLAIRRTTRQLRTRREVRVLDATHVEISGRSCINFAANNYLGLTHHPRLIAAAHAGNDGAGSGAAGLISGYSGAHVAAERALAAWKSTESAILLPSGYQANHAAVQTFAALAEHSAGGVQFLVDKLAHASLIDAVRGTGLSFRIFPHNHLAKLKRLLADADDTQLQIVITESIFSMDGDAADLRGLAALKESFGFALLLDEAHGSGVYGVGGAGYASELGLNGLADVSVCTLSKAAGGIGGAICGSRLFCDAVVNFGRSYIYSTSVPPMVARMAEAAIDVMREEPWRQQRVRALALEVRERLKSVGVVVPTGDSPIVPVILGDEDKTLEAADHLLAAGILSSAVRPPTVPRGGSRLRVTLSCGHTDVEVNQLIEALTRYRETNRAPRAP